MAGDRTTTGLPTNNQKCSILTYNNVNFYCTKNCEGSSDIEHCIATFLSIKNIFKTPCLSCTDTETTLHVPAVPHGSHTGLEPECINNKVWQHTGGTCVAPMLVPAWSPITASLFLLICSLEKLRSFLSAILGPGSEENIYCMTTWRR